MPHDAITISTPDSVMPGHEGWPPAWRHASKILAPLIADRTVILTGSAAGSVSLPPFLLRAGARQVVPLVLVAQEDPIDTWLARLEALLAKPTGEIAKAVTDADPTERALVYAGSHTAQTTFCGRPILGSRRPEQFAAEHKNLQASYLADTTRTLCVVDLSDTGAAARTIQTAVQSRASVLSGVPKGRLACGSSHTYLIARGHEERSRRIAELLVTDCDVAVMAPYDRGIHSTYYGFIAADYVIDFGPFEALVYWNPHDSRIAALGIVRPLLLRPAHLSAARRAVAYAAQRIHKTTGYTGAFCTDGVLQEDGYVVHELNPRMCAGFSLLSEICGGLSFSVLDIALRVGGSDASSRLRESLEDLSRQLGQQRPLLKLWDSKHKLLETTLRTAESSSTDSDGWLRRVRGALAREGFVPLTPGTVT